MKLRSLSGLLICAAAEVIWVTAASAQQAEWEDQTTAGGTSAAGNPTETAADESGTAIIVTARRREERDLDVPTAMSVLSTEMLTATGVRSFEDVSALTPGLRVSSTVSIFGGLSSIRGVGATSSDFLTDQAVAFTIDGATLTNGQAVQFGLFDIGRVEVLKGPQSLYYGRNTTAGIISVISAEPTDELAGMIRLGYDFEADGLLTEAMVSGPLTDTLRARLAYYRLDQDGLYRVPDTEGLPGYLGPIGPRTSRTADHSETNAGRLTLVFEPTPVFHADLRLSAIRRTGSSTYLLLQLFGCPSGAPSATNPGVLPFPQFQDCEADNVVSPEAVEDPATVQQFQNLDILQRYGGEHRYWMRQYLATGRMRYNFPNAMQLESITSYYDLAQDDIGSGTATSLNLFPIMARIEKRDFSQELRLTSDFDTPLNFMLGGLYQEQEFDVDVNVLLPNFLIPLPLPAGHFNAPAAYLAQDTKVYSLFGQVTYDLSEQFQLLLGGRYSRDVRRLTATDGLTGDVLPNALPRISFASFSPEVTLSWRPGQQTHVFLSYRQGTKSGGYSVSNYATQVNATDFYDNEMAEGVEGGIKTNAFDNQLRIDLTAYRYEYKDLQLGFFDPQTLIVSTANVGSARSYGIELDLAFRPFAIDGLTLSGNINYNHLRYGRGAIGSCYTGQSIAEGCNVNLVGGIYTAQDFEGHRPARSADWTGSARITYEQPVSGRVHLGGSLGAIYSSSFNPVPELDPQAEQSGYFLVNSQVRLFDGDDRWELAFIARNLFNTQRIQNGFLLVPPPVDLTGTATGGAHADKYGVTNNPRSVELRATFRF